MDINPINTKKNYQNIIEQFIGLIKESKLKIGDKLPPERVLAEMFNVSRASIREAFSAMEIIGLIEVCPGEGSFITNINIGPFINTIAPLFVKNDSMEKELLEFRKIVELEAVKLASEKFSEDKSGLFDEAIADMRKAIENNDNVMGAEADIKFHKMLVVATDNFILMKAAECIAYILESSVKFNREKILTDVNNSKVLLEQHIGILKAIQEKNTLLAVQRMEKHLHFVQEIL